MPKKRIHLHTKVEIDRTRLMHLAKTDWLRWTTDDWAMADWFIVMESGWQLTKAARKYVANQGAHICFVARTYVRPDFPKSFYYARGALQILTKV